ncbi:MAG TPA: response regulator transcription factor [Chloroflexota bacterium]
MSTRILVIDDDPSITSALRRGLSFEGYGVDVASSGKDGLEIARSRPPDLVILDVMLPGLDGLEVCRRLRSADSSIPIVMLTARDSAGEQVLGLDVGADDYVVKPFTFEVLLARIRALLRRVEPPSVEVLRFSDLILDTGTHTARRGEREIDLTTTEYELLQQFIRHPRQILAKEQLVDRVWGYDFEGNYNILEVYVRYLRTKLESAGEPRLIHTVRGAGYLLRKPREGEEET